VKLIKVHSKASQFKKFSLNYLYTIILLLILSNGTVLACHHLGQTSNFEPSNIGVNEFYTELYSEVFLGISKFHSIDQKVPYSNSDYKRHSVKDLQEKTNHTVSTSLYSYLKAVSKCAAKELDCCISHSKGCSNNHLCLCSSSAKNDLYYYQLNLKQGPSTSFDSINDISTNKKSSLYLIVTTKLIPHPSYFSLYESWLI